MQDSGHLVSMACNLIDMSYIRHFLSEHVSTTNHVICPNSDSFKKIRTQSKTRGPSGYAVSLASSKHHVKLASHTLWQFHPCWTRTQLKGMDGRETKTKQSLQSSVIQVELTWILLSAAVHSKSLRCKLPQLTLCVAFISTGCKQRLNSEVHICVTFRYSLQETKTLFKKTIQEHSGVLSL